MKKLKQNLYIDCSATYYLGINTGIQRVVRNIVKRTTLIAEKNGISCIPVVSRFGEFWQSEQFRVLHVSSETLNSMVRRGSSISVRLEAHEKAVLKQCEQFKGLIVYAYAISAIRRLVRYAGYAILQTPFLTAWVAGRIQRLQPGPGDLLLMPDAFWAYDVLSPLQKKRYKHLAVIPMIHDLIPLTHPQYCDANFIRTFRKLLPKLCRRASAFICISHATRQTLQQFLLEGNLMREHDLPMALWYSGSDLASEPDAGIDKLPIRDEIRIADASQLRYLMVGTIEPRKGYDYVFHTFSALWEEGRTDTLVIVGRIGWMCEALLQSMLQSPYYERYLFVYTDANDRELDHLYRTASALIFASRVEGFGLPMVEAMQNGLQIIASDIDVFKEIGGNYPKFFKVGDQEALKTIIINFDPATQRHDSLSSWYTWDEAAFELMTTTIRLAKTYNAEWPQ